MNPVMVYLERNIQFSVLPLTAFAGQTTCSCGIIFMQAIITEEYNRSRSDVNRVASTNNNLTSFKIKLRSICTELIS